MRIVKQITDNKFINIKEIKDPDKHLTQYQFAERLGVDSVAFVCWDSRSNEILLNKEYKPPVDEFILGAFGGSMDKDKAPEDIVIAEVKEEADFSITDLQVYELGEVMVSTQMNQMCKLYLVEVDRSKQEEREPENAVEAMAETEWVKWDYRVADKLKDWKPLVIVMRAEINGIIPQQF